MVFLVLVMFITRMTIMVIIVVGIEYKFRKTILVRIYKMNLINQYRGCCQTISLIIVIGIKPFIPETVLRMFIIHYLGVNLVSLD